MLLLDRIPHLRLYQRRDLVRAVEILFQEFEEAQKGKLSDKARRGRILHVILFGSFARGDWRDDPAHGFVSDFDLLVIVNDERFAQDYEAWERAEDRFIQIGMLSDRPRPAPNVIVHTYQDANDQLARGLPFFADIRRDGISLYAAEGYPLAEPGPLGPEERQAQAQLHFSKWYPDGADFLVGSHVLAERENLRLAAFLLHQSAESLYHCSLLVLTLYSPKLHKLRKLRSMVEDFDARLAGAWPRDTRLARRRFNLLHDAYVKARYSPHYAITAEELAWLTERVEALSRIVDTVCRERLGALP